ncbi:hypothetical protein [Paenibacillus psychroresistens]|uniref:hypothetical protein n=1 Tax=Paenibacillus psychroresistens TaxID=1778678 RepID=UPI0012DAA060|nr:hypothetical protein [Paenibacillus psychroresistens]
MNSFYEYETRMNQVKSEIEKKAREAWKLTPHVPHKHLNFQFIKSFMLWLQSL